MDATEAATRELPPAAVVQPRRSWLLALWFWVRRYAPPEVSGTVTMVLSGTAVAALGAPAVVVGLVATIAESVGFYAIAGIAVWREQRRNFPALGRLRILARVIGLMLVEFGSAEVLDTVLVRPASLTVALLFIPNVAVALVAGKVVADVVFYVLAATAFRVTEKTGLRGEADVGGPD
ncbi:hypothetical protein [Microbacterium mangrovi]|uniref:hypothetical protein n=1 Tax=Microbacterium mangrovi TaxID=1348253 RepID=UPI00068FE3B1|nr:hypothetical protein [Microbacterium mangrovi]